MTLTLSRNLRVTSQILPKNTIGAYFNFLFLYFSPNVGLGINGELWRTLWFHLDKLLAVQFYNSKQYVGLQRSSEFQSNISDLRFAANDQLELPKNINKSNFHLKQSESHSDTTSRSRTKWQVTIRIP